MSDVAKDRENAPDLVEQKVGSVAGVKELEKQSGTVDQYQEKLTALSDPSASKEKVAGVMKKAAINHFAGKEKQLQAAMDKMAKYKFKTASPTDIKQLGKRPVNAMKGKPFLERVVTGLYFQYQQKGLSLYDFNPYFGYRISGRFTAGIGWNHRYGRDTRLNRWDRNTRIYGPRSYADVRVYKGFIGHVEIEVMNAFVHRDLTQQNYQEGQREWVSGTMTGMKKDYKIYKNLRGTVLLQYNIFNSKFKAPYVDRLNSRIGIEYLIHKQRN